MFKKLLSHFQNNIENLKDFGINSISGLLTGVAIGIFFSLTTDITFNRWINLFSNEIFAAIVYVFFVLIILAFFYGLGILITWFIDKNKMMSFHLNFVSGTYCSIMSFLFVLYYNTARIRNSIAVIGIIIWIIIAGFTIKKKRPK